MFVDRFSNNVKGVSWEPAWSHRTVVSAFLAYVCKCLYLSVRGRGRGRPRSTCARECICRKMCIDYFDVAVCKYLRAPVFGRALNSYVVFLRYRKDRVKGLTGDCMRHFGYFPLLHLFSSTQTQPDPLPFVGVGA